MMGLQMPGQRLVQGVEALLKDVAAAVNSRFSACSVHGELSGFARVASGHCYFSLKDADGGSALIRCVMFRRSAGLLGFLPADGQRVELRGRLGVYEPRGELQFVVEAMQRAGAGALYEQFLQMRARLEAEGLFDPASRRSLPRHPGAIGIVTSPSAAALHDVMTALARRVPHIRVVLYPSLVQGPDAPASLVAALALASRRAEVDVLIVCRGGGSLEDLWSFNDERVVRAVRTTSMPVVCGVGHETDVTLADLAADLRAPTPTAAAELAATARDVDLARLMTTSLALQRWLHDALDLQAQRLDRNAMRLTRPAQVVRRHAERLSLLSHRFAATLPIAARSQRSRLDALQHRLYQQIKRQPVDSRHRLDSLAARLRALDPTRVLARGYAWLADSRGVPVTSVERIEKGVALRAVLHDGAVDVGVTRVERF